jgi:hypothetical protein
MPCPSETPTPRLLLPSRMLTLGKQGARLMADKKIADKLLGRFLEFGGLIVFAAGALTSLGGLGFVLYQCALWLRDGNWTHRTIRYALGEPPRSSWGGVAQIIDWVWMQPLGATMIFGGFLVVGLGIVITMKGEEIARA